MSSYRLRRVLLIVILLVAIAVPLANTPLADLAPPIPSPGPGPSNTSNELYGVVIKGRAPKTGYERSQFGGGWESLQGCDTRNRVLLRDLKVPVIDANCKVQSGILDDPYTGKTVYFIRGETTSDDVQIDHVVALSNAWQTGAQQLTFVQRVAFANDPLNLLAVDGQANQEKSDGDAATWLPPNKAFRCQYVKRQTEVKKKYGLWFTPAEATAIKRIVERC